MISDILVIHVLFYNWLTLRTVHKEPCVSFLFKLNLFLFICYMCYLYFKIKGIFEKKSPTQKC